VIDFEIDELTGDYQYDIIDWNEINLMENDRICLDCCGKMKNGNQCDKKASFYLQLRDNEKNIGFCKTHRSQADDYWNEQMTKKLFKEIKEENKGNSKTIKCNYLKKSGTECGKNASHSYDKNKNYYCTAHYKSQLKKKTTELSLLPIKNLIVKKFPTSQLQLNLVVKLDQIMEHLSILGVEEVIIENQPSMKNPKMKSIASTLFDYFIIRGYVDKIHNIDLKLIRYMCPSNKLKVNENNTLEVFKKNKDDTKKYKLTKNLGIEYTRKLLQENDQQIKYLDLFKKKDDLCDSFLQGLYYLRYIRHAKVKARDVKKKSNKTNSGSKQKNKKVN